MPRSSRRRPRLESPLRFLSSAPRRPLAEPSELSLIAFDLEVTQPSRPGRLLVQSTDPSIQTPASSPHLTLLLGVLAALNCLNLPILPADGATPIALCISTTKPVFYLLRSGELRTTGGPGGAYDRGKPDP